MFADELTHKPNSARPADEDHSIEIAYVQVRIVQCGINATKRAFDKRLDDLFEVLD